MSDWTDSVGSYTPTTDPVIAAYMERGAIKRACLRCGAREGEFCGQNGSQAQKMPCIARITQKAPQ